MIKIALDMMGGDLGIAATVAGVGRYDATSSRRDVVFHMFGNERQIRAAIAKIHDFPTENFIIHDTGDKVVMPDEQPARVIRNGKGTSMFEAIGHTASGKSDAVISSGNTGAYMVLSKTNIGMMNNIDRPAIAGIVPNMRSKSIMLDLGANTSCSAAQLVQFAVMGEGIAKVVLGIENPTIGLLNIGTEKSKGTDALCDAYKFLKDASDLDFAGFIEGTDIMKGTVDVIVTDGFSGNIALKTMEGTIKCLAHLVKNEVKKSILGKAAYLLSIRAANRMRAIFDPQMHNGAPLAGLQKIAVKSHGCSNDVGFASAISVAVKLAEANFVKNVAKAIESKAEQIACGLQGKKGRAGVSCGAKDG